MLLTEKQQAVLQFIEDFQMCNGKSPTLREMREHFGLHSDNAILKHLTALEKKHLISKTDTPRGINLLDSVKNKLESVVKLIQLPLLGEIPAGSPVLSEENRIDLLTVGEIGVKDPSSSFLLKVRGDSMEDAGILDGDFVIAHATQMPKPQDIVVALIDSSVTVKRYMIDREGKSYLQPENKKYRPLYPESNLLIQGVVTGLIRSY